MDINLTPFPTLTTNRLTLRQLQPSDSAAVFQLRSDDRVNAFLDRDKAVTVKDAENFIEKIEQTITKNEGIYWVITLKDEDWLIGTICYYNFDNENNTAELGYELLPQYHGQGIMQEAAEAVIAYGSDTMQLSAITACPRTDNEPSIKLLKRNGFEFDNVEDGYAMYVLRR